MYIVLCYLIAFLVESSKPKELPPIGTLPNNNWSQNVKPVENFSQPPKLPLFKTTNLPPTIPSIPNNSYTPNNQTNQPNTNFNSNNNTSNNNKQCK